MFDAVADLPVYLVLCGVIWSLAMGFAVGNYACSLVHRLPRGRLILDKKPYCGNCGTLLRVKDLFPVFSALSLKHRCRYCGSLFPVSHTWTEVLVGILFVLAFFKLNFSEQYILIVVTGVFLITLAAIHANEGMVMVRVLLCAVVFGMLYRVLQDHTIYGFCAGGFYALILAIILWRKQIKAVGHIYQLPEQAQLLVAGGICVGISQFLQFLVLYIAFYIWGVVYGKISSKAIVLTVPFGLAVVFTLLYPVVL